MCSASLRWRRYLARLGLAAVVEISTEQSPSSRVSTRTHSTRRPVASCSFKRISRMRGLMAQTPEDKRKRRCNSRRSLLVRAHCNLRYIYHRGQRGEHWGTNSRAKAKRYKLAAAARRSESVPILWAQQLDDWRALCDANALGWREHQFRWPGISADHDYMWELQSHDVFQCCFNGSNCTQPSDTSSRRGGVEWLRTTTKSQLLLTSPTLALGLLADSSSPSIRSAG